MTRSGAGRHNLSNPFHSSFDLIVANPPYVPTSLWLTLNRSVCEHEPRLALDGGEDGMSVIGPILAQAGAFLKPNGLLALELDPAESVAVRQIAPAGTVEKDWQGLDRYLFMTADKLPKAPGFHPCR